MSVAALLIVLVLCWLAMVYMGDWYHRLFGRVQRVEVPDDASALLSDPALTAEAPCDTCDGMGGGQLDGELALCPDCRGTGIVRP